MALENSLDVEGTRGMRQPQVQCICAVTGTYWTELVSNGDNRQRTELDSFSGEVENAFLFILAQFSRDLQ